MALSQPMVKIRFEGKNLADLDFFTKSDPYLVLSRPASKGSYDFKQIRKTETIKNNLNPSWKLIYISLSELCDNDVSLPIRLSVFDNDHNSHDDLIGQTETSLQDLMSHSVSGAPLVLKIGEKKRGELCVRQCETENSPTRKVSSSSYPERKASNVSLNGFSAPPQYYSQQMHPGHMQQPPQPHLAPPQEVYRPHLNNQQTPMGGFFHQPDGAPYQPQPQVNYQQAPMNYQQYQPQVNYHQAQAPTFQNYPPLPQHSTFPAVPDDPTDQRPQSIWINQ